MKSGSRTNIAILLDRLLGARVEQVGEHFCAPSALFVFEIEAYPEAKILNSVELKALRQQLGDWHLVAESIGVSEAFARQNAKNNDA